MKIILYNDSFKKQWDDFVRVSRNGTFLLCRDFIEYHADRFKELSYMVFDDKDRLLAVMAGHVAGKVYYSHRGLTYGGLVLGDKIGAGQVLEFFEHLKFMLKQQGFSRIEYKVIPHIYHRQPAEEDQYALFRIGAKLSERHISSTIDLQQNRIAYSDLRKRKLRSSFRNGIVVEVSSDYESFWKILTANLDAKYGKKPVHSLSEIEYLVLKFPDNIKLFVARDAEGGACGGCVVFLTDTVAHIQYVAATELGKRVGAVDTLIDCVVNSREFEGRRYFDYGISTEDGGLFLNKGLVAQKEGFGARGTLYDVYIVYL